MPDDTPAPKPVKKPRKSPGPISAETLASLSLAEKVATGAVNPTFEAGFTHQEVPLKFRQDNAKLVTAARRTVARAIRRTSEKTGATAEEKANKAALLGTIRDIQKQAKRKHEATAYERLATYAVGEALDDFDELTQAAITIHSQLVPDEDKGETAPADVLPTVNAAKIKELEDRYADYTGEDLKQAKAQGGATGERASLKDQMAVINVQRRQLQQAMDSEFPHDAAGTHAEQRSAFGLDPHRPLT